MHFRDHFLAIPAEPAFEVVQVPDSFHVRVYCMTAGEKDTFDIAHAKAEGKDFRARLLVATVRDGEGKPVFRASDVPILSGYPVPIVEPLVTAAVRVNRMQDDVAEATEKN